jgi:hypothetical protein
MIVYLCNKSENAIIIANNTVASAKAKPNIYIIEIIYFFLKYNKLNINLLYILIYCKIS